MSVYTSSTIVTLAEQTAYANKDLILKHLRSGEYSHIYESRARQLIHLLEADSPLSLEDSEDCLDCLKR